MPAAIDNDYVLQRNWRKQYSQDEIDDIIAKLHKWAYESDGIFIASFTWENYKKPGKWLTDLARHHQDLKDAMEHAKELISAKVAYHCYLNDRNSTFGEKMLSMHSPAYREHQKWLANVGSEKLEKAANAFDAYLSAQKVFNESKEKK